MIHDSVLTKRVFIISDIHGDIDRFRSELVKAGVQDEVIPSDITVVQIGDLVHGRGQSQSECVLLADRLLRENNGRYIQLLGNHDAHYLGGPSVQSRSVFRQADKQTIEILKSWQDKDLWTYALSIDNFLITHAGLTAGVWKEIGSPQSVNEAARAINYDMAFETLMRPGFLMSGELNYSAGILCSRTAAELAQSWLLEKQMPFSQIHGHESAWWWPDNNWHEDVPQSVKQVTKVDHIHRHSRTKIGDKILWSIDGKLDTVSDKLDNSILLELSSNLL